MKNKINQKSKPLAGVSLSEHRELCKKVAMLERMSASSFKELFLMMKMLVTENKRPKQRMGFRTK